MDRHMEIANNIGQLVKLARVWSEYEVFFRDCMRVWQAEPPDTDGRLLEIAVVCFAQTYRRKWLDIARKRQYILTR